MKLTQLETFVVVAEELHFRRAADRLHTQPSSVSTQIRQLEAEYGTQLFIRNSRNVELSPAGTQLLEKARHVLAGIADLEATARSLANPDDVDLTIGVMDEGLAELTQVVISDYAARYPGATVSLNSLSYDSLRAAFDDDELDGVVTIGPPAWFDPEIVAAQPLFAEERLCAMPRRHELARRATLTTQDLLDLPFVRYEGLAPELYDFFFLGDRRDPERSPDVMIEVAHMHSMLDKVAQGLGIFTVTHGNVRFYPRPDIAYVPVPDLEPGLVTVATRRSDERPHVVAFIEECVNAVQTSLDLIPTAVDATGSAP